LSGVSSSDLQGVLGRFNLTSFAENVKQVLLGPLLDTIIILIILFLILRITKFILTRLQRRDVIPGAVAEHLYRLVSLISYITVAMLIIYVFTSAEEVIYALLALFIAVLLANWNIISSITSYYVMLSSRHIYRAANLIELPRLGIKGKIVGMSLLFTKVRTPAGRIVYVPNHIMVNEPVVQLTTIQSFVELEVNISSEKIDVDDVEKKIRGVIAEARLATRPQDIIVIVEDAKLGEAKLTVRIPIAGIEPRPSTINSIVDVLVKGLAEYKPIIKVKTLL
jgi:small-conductance mechanosensitive channel